MVSMSRANMRAELVRDVDRIRDLQGLRNDWWAADGNWAAIDRKAARIVNQLESGRARSLFRFREWREAVDLLTEDFRSPERALGCPYAYYEDARTTAWESEADWRVFPQLVED